MIYSTSPVSMESIINYFVYRPQKRNSQMLPLPLPLPPMTPLLRRQPALHPGLLPNSQKPPKGKRFPPRSLRYNANKSSAGYRKRSRSV